MTTYTARTPTEQKAWNDGFNSAVELCAKRLELLRSIESVRELMLPDGPTREQIDIALGLRPTQSVTINNSPQENADG